MVLALALSLVVAPHLKPSFEGGGVPFQSSPVWWVLGYFFGAVVVIAVILFLLPLRYLKYVFRLVFAVMFAWGVLVISFSLPSVASYIVAAIAGIAWFFFARIWLHNLLLLIALAAASAVFGYLFSPLTFIIFILVVSVYDVLAVRFGFMVWMADRLSGSVSLPAFIFPRKTRDLALNLQAVQVSELKKEAAEKREHTILGGGDIGFPLMLANSVYFDSNTWSAVLVGAFAIVGLMGAFIIQKVWLKGRPMPALPPIAIASVIGYLIASNFLG